MRPRKLSDIPRRGQEIPVGISETMMTVQTVDAAGLPVVGDERLDDPETYETRLALLARRLSRCAGALDQLDMGGIGENLPRQQVA